MNKISRYTELRTIKAAKSEKVFLFLAEHQKDKFEILNFEFRHIFPSVEIASFCRQNTLLNLGSRKQSNTKVEKGRPNFKLQDDKQQQFGSIICRYDQKN